MILPLVRICALATLLLAAPLQAQEKEQAANDVADPGAAIWKAANTAMQRGPIDVALIDQAVLHVPAGYGYVPRKESVAVMELMGNRTNDKFIGLIFPTADGGNWFATLDYTGEGYIKDDEAKNWDADALLDNLKQGTEADNEFREKRGIKPIEVTGWIERPNYDAANHRLVWSIGSKEKGAVAGDDNGVNYNTYVLGREGYISLDFVTSQKAIEAEKPIAANLLAAVEFKQGRRYTDFSASTDKIATYGIAALVGGVVLKKIGLFAVAAAFFAKFFKLFIVAFFAVIAPVYKKFFKRA
jgi:uncharacterized membrane-anchored protein